MRRRRPTLKKFITVADLAQSFDLKLLTTRGDLGRPIEGSYVAYAGLALAGYLDHLQDSRVVLLGESELGYLAKLTPEKRAARWRQFCAQPDLPCAITCHTGRLDADLLAVADEVDLPIMGSNLPPRALMPRLVDYLRHVLAPQKHLHGVAVDVYGMGLLLLGKSGVGKSECALELVKRGHRLISDDVIILKKVSDDRIITVCSDQLRHHMELRGVGLIDIRSIFGVGSVSEGKEVDLIIRLEEAKRDHVYERLGLDQQHMTIMGVPIPLLVVPVTEGKNLSIVIEAAAMNQHLRQLGINSARELTDRVFRRLNPLATDQPKDDD